MNIKNSRYFCHTLQFHHLILRYFFYFNKKLILPSEICEYRLLILILSVPHFNRRWERNKGTSVPGTSQSKLLIFPTASRKSIRVGVLIRTIFSNKWNATIRCFSIVAHFKRISTHGRNHKPQSPIDQQRSQFWIALYSAERV